MNGVIESSHRTLQFQKRNIRSIVARFAQVQRMDVNSNAVGDEESCAQLYSYAVWIVIMDCHTMSGSQDERFRNQRTTANIREAGSLANENAGVPSESQIPNIEKCYDLFRY